MNKTIIENPFFSEWDTPFQVPPFDRIKDSHYVPAFEKAMADQKAIIEKMVASDTLPTFENTIEVLEESDTLLKTVYAVFENMTLAHTNDTLKLDSRKFFYSFWSKKICIAVQNPIVRMRLLSFLYAQK